MEWLDLDDFSLLKDVEEKYVVVEQSFSSPLTPEILFTSNDDMETKFYAFNRRVEGHLFTEIYEIDTDSKKFRVIRTPQLSNLIRKGLNIDEIVKEYGFEGLYARQAKFELKLSGIVKGEC